MVQAIVKHTALDSLQKALAGTGIQGMTITEVKGFGRQKGYTEVYRGMEYDVRFLPKIKVEIAIPDNKLEMVLLVLQNSTRSGDVGDGKIFVYSLEEVVRIRTGERGEEAI